MANMKIETRKKAVMKDVLAVDKSTELQFKDEEAAKKWEQLLEINTQTPYSKEIVIFARRWAKYMQHLMEKHNKTIDKIAYNASRVSDIENRIVGACMYVRAVNLLVQYWKYGEDLKKWSAKG